MHRQTVRPSLPIKSAAEIANTGLEEAGAMIRVRGR